MAERYLDLEKIGEGAFGYVVKAKDILTGDLVAVKRVRLRHYGDERANNFKGAEGEVIPNHILREIKALQQLDHPNIVKLHEVFSNIGNGPSLAMVFELMHSDLDKVRQSLNSPLSEAQVKSYLSMMLKGIAHCHENSIIHRDLKPANLLIDKFGILKLADFGLARVHDERKSSLYTNQVATRWYKAPELLYGARKYDKAVDLWAVGCIFGELLTGSPLFRGDNDIDQLFKIVQILGTPVEEEWPNISELPDYNKITFNEMPPTSWEVVFPDVSPEALKMLSKFIKYPPSKRISADQALLEPYFFTEPLPSHPSELPLPSPETFKQTSEFFDVDAPLDLTFL